MQIADFEKALTAMVDYCASQGRAKQGTVIEGNCVMVDGNTYPYETAVPITCYAGKRVWVHIDGQKAVIIGA